MATTTNYAWETPDDTDLVKDGAAAIRTLGSSIDTTTKALNPSTTLGDIEYRSSTANTNTRLGIGSTGQVLTVSGGVPTWASPSGSSFPSFSAYKSAATQTLTSGSWTKITFDVENWDTANCFASSTFTPNVAGYYQINASLYSDYAAAGEIYVTLYKNGTRTNILQWHPTAIAGYIDSGTALMYFNGTTDYVEVYGRTDTSNTTIQNSSTGTWFSAVGVKA